MQRQNAHMQLFDLGTVKTHADWVRQKGDKINA
jgi:hypothetical protein